MRYSNHGMIWALVLLGAALSPRKAGGISPAYTPPPKTGPALLYTDLYCATPGVYDRTCIQNAIDAAPIGAEVIVRAPQGKSYVLSGSGPELILIALRLITLDCGSWSNPIFIDPSVPPTADIIHVFPQASGEGFSIQNCEIVPLSGQPARNAVFIDTSIALEVRLKIDHNYFGTFNGRAIVVQSPASGVAQFFASALTNNVLNQGVQLINAGDSIDIEQNVFRGTGVGLDVSMIYNTAVGSAALLTIANNDFATSGGCIHLGANANQVKIVSNRCENQPAGSASNNAQIDIDGPASAAYTTGDMIEVAGNRIVPAQDGINGIRVNTGRHVHIHDNWMVRAGSHSVDYLITSQAQDTMIHGNREEPSGDAATLTIANQSGTTRYERYYNGTYRLVIGGTPTTVATPVYGPLDHVQILPVRTALLPNQPVPFQVMPYDAMNHLLPAASVVQWSAAGGGTMAASGLFTAASAPGGPYSITAAMSGVSANAQLLVAPARPGSYTAPAVETALSADHYCSTPGVFDQTCIQNAINAAPAGGTVYVPAVSSYVLSGTGPQLILIAKPLTLQCSGWYFLFVASTVPATTDVIRIAGSGSPSTIKGVTINNCEFVPQNGKPARHGLYIDGTTAAINQLTLEHDYFGLFNGNGIYLNNPASSGGLASLLVDQSVIHNGMELRNAGSNFTITRSVVADANIGIDYSAQPGAVLSVTYDNITSVGGCLRIGGGASRVEILWNECENSVGGTGPDSGQIDISGAPGNPVQNVEIAANRIAPVQNGVNGIRVDNSAHTVIHDNWVARSGPSATDYAVTPSAVDTRIYNNEETPYGEADSLTINDQSGTTLYERYYQGVYHAVIENNPYSALGIVKQPLDETVPLGSTATFKVCASGGGYTGGLSYQWYSRGSPIAGANGASYTTHATTAADQGASFVVKVQDGTGAFVIGKAAFLHVTGLPPLGISQRSPDQTVNLGGSATFTIN